MPIADIGLPQLLDLLDVVELPSLVEIGLLWRAELELWQRKLLCLHKLALGQLGSCFETLAFKHIADKIDERLNPSPLEDLVADAKTLIARCSGDWVEAALAEVE